MIGLKIHAPLSHPIKSKAETNREPTHTRFPALATAACNFLEFGLVPYNYCLCPYVFGYSDYFGLASDTQLEIALTFNI